MGCFVAESLLHVGVSRMLSGLTGGSLCGGALLAPPFVPLAPPSPSRPFSLLVLVDIEFPLGEILEDFSCRLY